MNLRASIVLALVVPWIFGSCAFTFPASSSAEVKRVEVARTQKDQGSDKAEEIPTVPVIVFADKLHTGLILQLDWLKENGYVPPPGIGSKPWVAFSWGDETAYVQKEWLGIGQLNHALFQRSRSVMEIIPFDYNVPSICHHQRLYLGHAHDSDGAKLAAFLNACAIRDENGVPETLGESSWGGGRMIRSPHSYYFPRICNVWTVEALKSAGFSMLTPTGLSADGVIRQVTKRKNGFQKIWDPDWQMEEE